MIEAKAIKFYRDARDYYRSVEEKQKNAAYTIFSETNYNAKDYI